MQDKPKDLTSLNELPANSPNNDGIQASPKLGLMPGDMSPDQANCQLFSKPEHKLESASVKEDTEALEDAEPEYPSSWKLAVIMLGLCFAVFCMALVCKHQYVCRRILDNVLTFGSGQHYHSNCNTNHYR